MIELLFQWMLYGFLLWFICWFTWGHLIGEPPGRFSFAVISLLGGPLIWGLGLFFLILSRKSQRPVIYHPYQEYTQMYLSEKKTRIMEISRDPGKGRARRIQTLQEFSAPYGNKKK